MPRIFISYKRADKEKVFKIKDQIESALGEKCWIDLDGIESDAAFVEKIITAIDICDVFLFMYSVHHAVIQDYQKDWTVREFLYAEKQRKRIVFVNIDGSELAKWFLFMVNGKQQIDGLSVGALDKLCYDLEGWLFPEKKAERERKHKELPKEAPKILEEEKRKYHLTRLKGLLNRYSKKSIIASLAMFLVVLTVIKSFCLSVTNFNSQIDSAQSNYFELAIPFTDYEEAYSFHDGLARIKQNGKYGYIDKSGNEVISCQYDVADDFHCHRACVRIDGKYGYINKNGNLIIACDYDMAGDFYENLACVKKDGKYGFVDIFGKNAIPNNLNYDLVVHFSEGLAMVKKKGKYGYIDKSGKEVIHDLSGMSSAGHFYEGLARAVFGDDDGRTSGFIDQNGKLVISGTEYFAVGNFNEGFAEVNVTDEWGEDSKYGFIDKTGKIVIPCIYDNVAGFNDGFAYFEKDGSAGFINKFGKQVITLKNVEKPLFGYYFNEGFAAIEKDGKHGYINKVGEEATTIIYDDAYPILEGYALVKLNGQYGYLKVIR